MFSITGNEMNKKWKTKVLQNLGRGNKVHYARCANGECHELYAVQKQLWVTSGKDFFLWLLDCLQPSIFVFQYFFFLIHELGGSIHTKCEGVGRGACLFPLTPVRLAHTSLDFLNVSSSFPRLWTSFLLNPFNLRMNDEARLGNTGMKPPQRYFRMVLFVLEHFT